MIKVTYDSEVDAKYVSIKEGEFFETKIINDWLFFDVNKAGDVLGIEILDSSKSNVTIATFEDNLVNINFSRKGDGLEPINQDYGTQKEYLESKEFAVAA